MGYKHAAVALLVGTGLFAPPHSAGAAVDGGDGPGGTVTVGASSGGYLAGSSGGPTGNKGGALGGSPWLCTYTSLTLNDEGGFAPGGPTPGGWYSVTCTDQSDGGSTTNTDWIPDGSTGVTPDVDPHSIALQAENSLHLPSPALNFNPPAVSIVNLPTWMWIDSSMWHPYSVSASVGSVSATAVATPMSVTWSTGDGGVVICDGPGTAFDVEEPASQQTTQCTHTFGVSSAGQPSSDGNPNDGAFVVVATIDWTVSWLATGATGGGTLPPLTTSTSTQLRVEQVESVNAEPTGFSGDPAPLGSMR
jgi:hypothetical protein